MAKTRVEKIDGIDEEIARLRKRQTLLRQQQNRQDRKDRTHRLCRRGGLVEKFLPDLARLTDEQFDTFVEKVLLTSHTRRVLAELAPPLPEPTAEPECGTGDTQDGSAAEQKPADTAAQPNTSPAPKPTVTAERTNATPTAKPANTPTAPSIAAGSKTGATTETRG